MTRRTRLSGVPRTLGIRVHGPGDPALGGWFPDLAERKRFFEEYEAAYAAFRPVTREEEEEERRFWDGMMPSGAC